MCLHSHHLLLGVLEALCDEVERLVLGDGVLGHARLLGVETLQLGLAWNMSRKVMVSPHSSMFHSCSPERHHSSSPKEERRPAPYAFSSPCCRVIPNSMVNLHMDMLILDIIY